MGKTARLGLKVAFALDGIVGVPVEMGKTARLGLKGNTYYGTADIWASRNGEDSPVGIESCWLSILAIG